MYMSMCIYICMCICMYIFCMCVSVYVCKYMHVYMCIFVCMHVCFYPFVCTCVHVFVCACVCAFTLTLYQYYLFIWPYLGAGGERGNKLKIYPVLLLKVAKGYKNNKNANKKVLGNDLRVPNLTFLKSCTCAFAQPISASFNFSLKLKTM